MPTVVFRWNKLSYRWFYHSQLSIISNNNQKMFNNNEKIAIESSWVHKSAESLSTSIYSSIEAKK